jgi:hypothetical protein
MIFTKINAFEVSQLINRRITKDNKKTCPKTNRMSPAKTGNHKISEEKFHQLVNRRITKG